MDVLVLAPPVQGNLSRCFWKLSTSQLSPPPPTSPHPRESGGSGAAPDLLSQQLVTRECTLAIKMPRPAFGGSLVTLCLVAAHRTDELPAKDSTFSPSYSLAAVTEFASFLSCKFQGFSLCYKSSFIPISCNLHFWYFLGNSILYNSPSIISLNYFFNGLARNIGQCGSKGIWREIWDSRCQISLHSQNQLKCSKCQW